MKRRCLNPHADDYKDYGGRGIAVHFLWARSFHAFLAAVGRAPSSRHSLDRIDPNGHYVPDNVRWATPEEQAANRRPCGFKLTAGQVAAIRIAGRARPVAALARRYGVSPDTIRDILAGRTWRK